MKLKLLFASLLIVGLPLGSAVTMAQTADEEQMTIQIQSETEPGSEGEVEQQPEKRKERIEARKQQVQERIDFARTQRLKTNCSAAQGKIRSLEARVKGARTSRQAVYSNLQERLEGLSTKLNGEGVDTTALDGQRERLKTEVDSFFTTLEAYELAVSDLAAMDCAADTEGFNDTLQTVRSMLPQLKQQAEGVRSLLKDEIKPTLQLIKQQIDSTNEVEGETE